MFPWIGWEIAYKLGTTQSLTQTLVKRLAIVKCIPLKFSSRLATIKIIMIILARMGRRWVSTIIKLLLYAGPDLGVKIDFIVFIASIISATVLAIALTLCVTVIITAVRLVIKKRARSLKSLQRANTGRHQTAETRAYEPVAHHPKSDCVTLENEEYAANCK